MTLPSARFHQSGARRVPGLSLALAIAGTLGALSGCASSIPGVTEIPVTANPSDEISALGGELQQARDADVNRLAPTWFGRAEHSFESARRLRDDGGPVQAILADVAEGRAALEQARSLAAVSRETLPGVIRARDDALAAGAASLASYDAAEARFVELTEAIEGDSLAWARKHSDEVEKRYRSIELDAIKRNTLERIDDLIAKAKAEGAPVLVPHVLAETETERTGLETFISNNRYAAAEIADRASTVLFDANRLVHLTQRAKAVASATPEQLALASEDLLESLRLTVALPDARNQSFATQVRSLDSELAALKRERDDLRLVSADQRSVIARLRGENEAERIRVASLEEDRQFNQLFAEVSSRFSPEEAEVYKEGSNLVLRLRSLRFPSGSTVVLPESYPLMTKVQDAIRAFGETRVVIEGHTDSTGSTEINDTISQRRADAVRAYLVANGTVADGDIEAVGKGFSEPLASDRTAEGRAQNRRIDVVIEPVRHENAGADVAAGPPRE